MLQKMVIPVGGSGNKYTKYTNLDIGSSASTSHTLTGVSKGDIVLLLLWSSSGSSLAYNRFDGATCSGGNITQLTNLLTSNANSAGTFYFVECTSDVVTVTQTNSHRLISYRADA